MIEARLNLESIDAYAANAIANYIAVMCNEQELSIKEMFSEHRKKLNER